MIMSCRKKSKVGQYLAKT